MRPGVQAMVRSLVGAAMLVRFDRKGLDYIDDSDHSVLLSCQAAVVAATAGVILAYHLHADLTASYLHFLTIYGLTSIIAWAAGMLIANHVAQMVDPKPRFARFLVAWNWLTVLHVALVGPALMIESGFGWSPTVSILVFLVTFLGFLAAGVFAARSQLRLPWMIAIGVPCFAGLCENVMNAIARGLLGV